MRILSAMFFDEWKVVLGLRKNEAAIERSRNQIVLELGTSSDYEYLSTKSVLGLLVVRRIA
jgi:hypothetical protein